MLKGADQIADGLRLHFGIAVDRDEDLPAGTVEADEQGVTLATVGLELENLDPGTEFFGGTLHPDPGVVLAAVVDADDLQLVGRIITGRDAADSIQNLAAFIIGRDDDAANRQLVVLTGRRVAVGFHQIDTPEEQNHVEGDDRQRRQQEKPHLKILAVKTAELVDIVREPPPAEKQQENHRRQDAQLRDRVIQHPEKAGLRTSAFLTGLLYGRGLRRNSFLDTGVHNPSLLIVSLIDHARRPVVFKSASRTGPPTEACAAPKSSPVAAPVLLTTNSAFA